MSRPIAFLLKSTAADMESADVVFFSFPREMVESGSIHQVARRLQILRDNIGLSRRLEGRCVLHFDGYDDDPRELYEIPECRTFFEAVTRLWPYWFHYLDRGGESLLMALSLLVPTEKVVNVGNRVSALMDPAIRHSRFVQLIAGLGALHHYLGLDHNETERMVDDVGHALRLN